MTEPNTGEEERKEMGNQATSQQHPPHMTENDAKARVGKEGKAEPTMPANASGTDKVDADDQDQPIREESMYDNRPEEDKHHRPA